MSMPNSVSNTCAMNSFRALGTTSGLFTFNGNGASKSCMAVTYNCAPTTARRCRGAGSACVTYVNTCWIAALSSSAVGSFFLLCPGLHRRSWGSPMLSPPTCACHFDTMWCPHAARLRGHVPCCHTAWIGLFLACSKVRVTPVSGVEVRTACRAIGSRFGPPAGAAGLHRLLTDMLAKCPRAPLSLWVRPGPSQLQVPCPSAVMLGSDPVLFHPWSWRVVGCSWKQWNAQGHLSKQITCCSIWCQWKCIHDSDFPRLFEKGLTLAAVSSVTLYFPCCPQLKDGVHALSSNLQLLQGAGLFNAVGMQFLHENQLSFGRRRLPLRTCCFLEMGSLVSHICGMQQNLLEDALWLMLQGQILQRMRAP